MNHRGLKSLPAAWRDWLQVEEREGIVALREPLERVNSFLILGQRRALLVDTGTGVLPFSQVVQAMTSLPVMVVLTHGHWDHVGSAGEFPFTLGAQGCIPEPPPPQVQLERAQRGLGPLGPAHAPMPTVELAGGERLHLGGLTFVCLRVTGHTQGDLVLWEPQRGWLVTGDLAYAGGIELTGPEAHLKAYQEAVGQLARLEGVRLLLAGHEEPFLEGSFLDELAQSVQAKDWYRRAYARHRFLTDSVSEGTASATAPRGP